MVEIHAVDLSLTSFKNSYRKLPPDIQNAFKKAVKVLLERRSSSSFPPWLRFEKLSGYKKPSLYTIHITANHSHKASFELKENVAIFRQVGTHGQLDREP